jgi:hypothetical protein
MASNARTSSRGVERADNQGLKTGAKDLERPALRPPLLHSLRLPVFDARVRTTNKLLVYEPRAKFAAAVGINTNIANVAAAAWPLAARAARQEAADLSGGGIAPVRPQC